MVAAAEETDPCLLPPLYDTIDPEPIGQLLVMPAIAFAASFDYVGYHITITQDGCKVEADGVVRGTRSWETPV